MTMTSTPVKYRCPMTHQTWSGRGLQPAWLKAALSGGAKLADFVVTDGALSVLAPAAPEAAPADRQAMVRAVALRVGYQLPMEAADADLIQRDIAANMRRSVEACLEVGRGLAVLKAACEHGQFMARLDVLGIEPRVAQRFMASAAKFSNAASTPLLKAAGNQTKLFELLVLDDDQVDELVLTGQTGELALDDVATMSVKELRAAVREAKEERKAQEDLSAAKSKQIDKLKLQLKRIQAAPPDEVLADLKKEATALAGDAQGLIMGTLRLAVQAIADHGDDGLQAHRAFLAGLLAPLQVELTALRHEFELPDLADEAVKTPFVQFADAEDRAEAAAAASQRAKG